MINQSKSIWNFQDAIKVDKPITDLIEGEETKDEIKPKTLEERIN